MLWDNQIPTIFELISRFNKHKVYLLTCDTSLKSCPANAFKKFYLCLNCKNLRNHYLEKLNVENISLKLNKTKINEEEILNQTRNIQDFNDLTSYRYENVPIGELVSSQLCDNEQSYILDNNFFLNKHEIINSEILSAIKLYERSKNIIKEKKIEKVYVWNGRRPSDGPVNYAAKNLSIPFKSFISNEKGRYHLVRGEKVHSYTETMKEFDKTYNYYKNKISVQEKEEIFKEYINKKKTGSLKKENFLHEDFTCNFKKKIDKKNLVTFFTSSGFEFAGFNDWKSPIYSNQYDAIKKIIFDPNLDKNINLCIRYHPNLQKAGRSEINIIQEILKIKKKNLIQISYDDEIDSYDILNKSLKVLTFRSTISYEAYAKKIPVISLGPSFDDYAGFAYKPKNHDEVISMINNNLIPKVSEKSINHALMFKKKLYAFRYRSVSNINEIYYFKNKKIKPALSFLFKLKIFLIKKIFN